MTTMRLSSAAVSPGRVASFFLLRALLLTPALLYGQSGSAPSTTNLSATGTGPYTFTATVAGHSGKAPNGSVTFTDQTASPTLGSASLGALSITQSFAAQTSYPLISTATSLGQFTAAADFNKDGFTDLAVIHASDNTVRVLLGSKNGTLTPYAALSVEPVPLSVATGDFNDDGNVDLIVAYGDTEGTDNIRILVGDGTGNFVPQSNALAGTDPLFMAIGDFNHDNKLDVALINLRGAVSILLGNGDGTLAPQSKISLGVGIDSVAMDDFNGDGNLDLAVVNMENNTLSILLGQGNGQFTVTTSTPVLTSQSYSSVAVGDFNGDNKPDLVLASSDDSTINVLLGDGQGAFAPISGSPILIGQQPSSIVVTDLNADGFADLAVSSVGASSVSVLMGKGDGTFDVQAIQLATGADPRFIVTGDFNGDGVPDLSVANAGNGTVSVLLNNLTLSKTATLPNAAVTGSGSHTIQASYSGDSTYAASSGTTSVTASLAHSILTLGAPVTVTAGQSTQLVASLSPATQSGVTATGVVTFTNTGNGATLGTAPLSNGTATLATSFATAGNVTIQATYNGDTNFASALSNPVNVTITPAASFTITPFPSTEYAVKRGTLGGFLLQLQSIKGFVGSVKLSCAGGPAGSYCANLPQTVTLNGTAWAGSGLYVPPKTEPGTYKVTFTGISGSITVTATANFVVSK